MRQILIAMSTTLVLAGCGTSHVSLDENGRTVVHHWGYTRIIKPPLTTADQPMNVTGYELMGFSVGEGFTLGYKSNSIIQVSSDCRVLVVVSDQEQFEHLLKHLDDIGAKDLCATVSPD